MKIQSEITETLGIYYVSVGLFGLSDTALTPSENEAIAAVGEPLVETGGSFSGLASFTLAAAPKSFPTQFPVAQKFAVADFNDAKLRAQQFRLTMEARIATALTATRSAFLAQGGAALYVSTTDTTP